MSNPTKSIGTVRWFNAPKGYGFIDTDSGDEVFVHHRAIQADGYRTLATGQQVEFIQTKSEKGWQAAEVVLLESA